MNNEKIFLWNKMFPLKDATVYPGKDFCDMVFSYPIAENIKKRLWLLTSAKNPIVKIDDFVFKPVKPKQNTGLQWLDLGTTSEVFTPDSKATFGQLRVYGLNFEEMQNSYLFITVETDKELSGSIEDAEETILGIKRQHAASASIKPTTVEVGELTKFTVTHEASNKGLPSGSYLLFFVRSFFPIPQNTDKNSDG